MRSRSKPAQTVSSGAPSKAAVGANAEVTGAPSKPDFGFAGGVPPQLLPALFSTLSVADRVRAVYSALESSDGPALRQAMAHWNISFLPVEKLVPDSYTAWRPVVQDAMLFVATNLSNARLAPKLIEQFDLPTNTPPEERLLRLIARVPGLQKLGQVLARNRHLHAALRNALCELENGISDVSPEDIHAIIFAELGQKLETYSVRIEQGIFSEASVSAVLRFTWSEPGSKRRHRGVFKVMKPYVPACYAEDMELLAQLAKFLGERHRQYGFAEHVLYETFTEVRRLLEHEVDFSREQATLPRAAALYTSVRGVRVPGLIRPLCTSRITAITEERGRKITEAVHRMPTASRRKVCEQLIESVLGVPLSAPEGTVVFHADPHAGNLLYNRRTGELTILDWALTENLTRHQRRHLGMLFLMTVLRDPAGLSFAIEGLLQKTDARRAREERRIRECVARFFREMPLAKVPGAMDAMDLLESLALEGVRFPAAMIMLRKVLFTLDGILHDIGGGVSIDTVIARQLLQGWMKDLRTVGSPLSGTDWLLVQCSTLLFGSRMSLFGVQRLLQRFAPQPNA
jgi:ubiquinone biosynthesis protein